MIEYTHIMKDAGAVSSSGFGEVASAVVQQRRESSLDMREENVWMAVVIKLNERRHFERLVTREIWQSSFCEPVFPLQQ